MSKKIENEDKEVVIIPKIVSITPPAPKNFTKFELSCILKVFKSCQTNTQKEMIMSFYKKYVNTKWNGTLASCTGCGRSFMDKFIETRNWVSQNNSLFIN